MEKYELLYILPAKYTEEELKAMTEKIGSLATNAGATITATHDMGKRKLAYPITHVRHGHYILVHFDAEPAVVNKLNEMFRLSTDLLRHLIVKRDPYLTNIPTLIEDERGVDEERPAMAAAKPTQAPVAADPSITMEDLDKKLDEILTEEVK